MRLARFGAVIAGLWGGLLLGIGFLAAPAGFAVAPRDVAGRVAGRLFAQEAYLSLAIAMLLLLVVHRLARAAGGSAVNVNVVIVLLALFCTIAGHFALLPLMDGALAGQGRLSFGTLHALSAGFYVAKTLAVVALAWRLCCRVLVEGPATARLPDGSPVTRPRTS